MQVQRAALNMLEGRVSLFYGSDVDCEAEYAADFHTIEDLGGTLPLTLFYIDTTAEMY